MMVQFIFMTIAFVIMLIVALIQQRTNKRLSKQLKEIEVKGWREVHGFGKVYNTFRRFIVIENAGDNATLNRTVEKYKEDGYEYDSQNSTDRLLVFAKHEEIKEVDPTAAAAASGEEDITEGGAGQGGNQGGGTTGGELEG